MVHACLSELQFFKGPVSYNALNESIAESVRNCESFVPNLWVQETRPATSKAAAETMLNDFKDIESFLNFMLDTFSNSLEIQLSSHKGTKQIPKTYCRMFAPTLRSHPTWPINAKRILLESTFYLSPQGRSHRICVLSKAYGEAESTNRCWTIENSQLKRSWNHYS